MTREQWERYIRRLEKCPDDCDTCVKKPDCLEKFEAVEKKCDFRIAIREGRRSMTPGNPCVEACGSSLKLSPISMMSVRGAPMVGDGRHRKWKIK